MKEHLIKMAMGALTISVGIILAQNVIQPMIDKTKVSAPKAA